MRTMRATSGGPDNSLRRGVCGKAWRIGLLILLGIPASLRADNTSVITYTLELGGDNHATEYEAWQTPQFTGGQTSTFIVGSADVVTWAVRVMASGTVDVPDGLGGTINVPVYGVANMAWTLELYDSSNNLVQIGAAPLACDSGTIEGRDCLNAHPIAPGFYSTINDGDQDGIRGVVDGPDDHQLAAFAYSFRVSGADPWARIIDVPGFDNSVNGPGMTLKQYPSATGFPAESTTPLGGLIGMSAGYPQFQAQGMGGDQRAGVGLIDGLGCGCSCVLGSGPVAEGQISLMGLPSGMYTLKLVPNEGNTVLAFDGSCDAGTEGQFSWPAGTVSTANDGQAQFAYGCWCSFLAVGIQPPAAVIAGAQWSTDGGATWWDSGENVLLFPGNYTVTFKEVAGFCTPAPQDVIVTWGQTTYVTAQYLCLPSPSVLSAASVKTHGTAGDFGIPFIGYTWTNPSGATNLSIECRQNGVTKAVIKFDQEVGVADGMLDIGQEVVVTCRNAFGPVLVTVNSVNISGNTLTINFANMVQAAYGGSCLKITLSGICAAGQPNAVMQPTCVSTKILRGDVTGDGRVLSGDISAVKAGCPRIDTSMNPNCFRRDLMPSGTILSGDVSLAKLCSGDVTTLPCTCP